MRLSWPLTNPYIILSLQQLIAIWFLFDFFIAQDSLTATTLWKSSRQNTYDPQSSRIQSLAREIQRKRCQLDNLDQQVFDKLVFIVIDALGSDFLPSLKDDGKHHDQLESSHQPNAMPFLEDNIRQRQAMGFIARAATPTVTMPRIKALLSGTIPSFVDIVYNLASDVSKFDDDNILRLAEARNKSIVFYGDDTWLSLFNRNVFTRVKETFSFFANDYTSVDTNVTEFALPESSRDIIDWDILILHYLGLDHIGHIFGSNDGKLVQDKLLEMDSVIKEIYQNLNKKEHKTLMIICGDHGMSEEGNHGGDTDLEADTAMIFLPINRNLHNPSGKVQRLKQIDLAATISILMGMPIPKMSKGVIIEPLLVSLCPEKEVMRSCAGLENVMELYNLTEHLELESSILLNLENLLSNHLNLNSSPNDLSHKYLKLSRSIQRNLLKSLAPKTNLSLVVIALIFITLLSIIATRRISIRLLVPTIPKREKLLCYLTFIFPIVMHGSTDFIELEHIFWPIFSITIFLLFIAISSKSPITKNVESFRLTSFGICFTLIFLSNNLKLFRSNSLLSTYILPSISITILFNSVRQISDLKWKKSCTIGLILILTASLFGNDIFERSDLVADLQRIAVIALILYTVANIASQSDRANHGSSLMICKLGSGWLCLSFLLARRYNYTFLISNMIMETSFNAIANTLNLSQVTRLLMYLNFAQSAFYCQGNSNLFSSLDVKPAFFGQTKYNVYLVVPLMSIATFSAQIYWIIKMFQRIQEKSSSEAATTGRARSINKISDQTSSLKDPIVGVACNLVIMRNFLSISYFMFVCLWLRNHLFIWSVISPKLIYHFVSNNVLLVTVLLINALSLRQPNSLRTKPIEIQI